MLSLREKHFLSRWTLLSLIATVANSLNPMLHESQQIQEQLEPRWRVHISNEWDVSVWKSFAYLIRDKLHT